jgi:hypothetical protein
MNNTVSEATNFTPAELMFDTPRLNLFAKLLPPTPGPGASEETLHEKTVKAYVRLKQRAAVRRQRRKKGLAMWDPQLRDPVLVRIMPFSEANQGVSAKLMRPFEGPYFISKAISPAIFEIEDDKGKPRGMFNKRDLKPFKTET